LQARNPVETMGTPHYTAAVGSSSAVFLGFLKTVTP
jgi:hypothetical protein